MNENEFTTYEFVYIYSAVFIFSKLIETENQ